MDYKKTISRINKIIGNLYALTLFAIYTIQYNNLYNKNRKNYDKTKAPTTEEIKEYKKLWRPLSKMVNLIYLKIFSQYGVGNKTETVPEDISHIVIENILNPPEYRGYFTDKNMFDRILGSGVLPKTYLRRIQGYFYDEKYNSVTIDEKSIEKYLPETFIIKPTNDTSSGKGICVFEKINDDLIDLISKKKFILEDINRLLGEDYIIQERMAQSDFMSHLCKTSINTLRLLVYRSVKDNKCHVLNSIIRIGHDGSLVDNAHAGGVFIGIDDRGKLRDRVCTQYGEISYEHNGIDFREIELTIPNWDRIKEFACKVGESIPYYRCLNLDVMIDKNGNPKLIEYNIKTMSVWLYQFVNGPCFGEYTQEVIDYCSKNKHKIKSPHLMA